MPTHDKFGREYAVYTSLKGGDMVFLDKDFTCVKAGPQMIHDEPEGLCFKCSHGRHFLDGQLGCDEDNKDYNHLIGVYPVRLVRVIAREIASDWQKPNYAAVPYLHALLTLGRMGTSYGDDSAHSIINYFLHNSSTWRGDVAKRIKVELKDMLKLPR